MSVHFEAYPLTASGCGATTSNRHKQTRVLLVGESSSTSIAILVKHSRLQFRKRRRENAAVRNWMDQRHVSHKTHTVCFFFFVYTFPERKKRRWLRPDKNTIRKKNEKDSGERCARLSLCAQCSSTRPFSSFDSTAVYFLFSLKARLARKTERMRDAHTQREREVYNIICVQWPRR